MAESGKTSSKGNARTARKARLAAALRENLKRRKQQARQRAVRNDAGPEKPSTAHTTNEPKDS